MLPIGVDLNNYKKNRVSVNNFYERLKFKCFCVCKITKKKTLNHKNMTFKRL